MFCRIKRFALACGLMMLPIAAQATTIVNPWKMFTHQKVWVSSKAPGTVTVSGQNLNGSRSKYQVNIYVDGAFQGNTFLEDGRFTYNVSVSSTNKNLQVKILEFYGQGKNGHYEQNFSIRPFFASKPIIQESRVFNGEMVVRGSNIRKDQNYQVNFYVNGKYHSQASTRNGNFRSVLRGLGDGDMVRVSILNYDGKRQHKDFYFTAISSRLN